MSSLNYACGRVRTYERRQKAWKEIRALLQQFREIDPTVDRLIVFGSRARDDMKRTNFDIDIAVRSSKDLQLPDSLEAHVRTITRSATHSGKNWL